VEKIILKLRNSRRNAKIGLSCISVWDGTGLYYWQQIVARPSSKRFVKALRIGFSYFIRIYPACSIVFCCLVYTHYAVPSPWGALVGFSPQTKFQYPQIEVW